jgi:hypothetical protein
VRRDQTGMEWEMKVLYIEGVAIHSGPESCVAVREGGGEALTGESAGRAIEPRNHGNRGADAVSMSGRQHRCQRYCELAADLARSENHGMHGSSMRENREVPCSPAGLITRRAAQGRPRPQA